MSTKENYLLSPVGSIQFMAAENPVKQDKSDNKEVYTVKLAFDVEKDKDFLAQISEINDTKVVTAQTYRGKVEATKKLLATGKALVSANSVYKPEIYDNQNNQLEEAPMFFGDSTGSAQMIIQPWRGEKGNSINLIGIIIHNVESSKSEEKGITNRKERLAQIRDLIKGSTK